jgi:23S rRNA (uracil1939-C5)-methyltransferase
LYYHKIDILQRATHKLLVQIGQELTLSIFDIARSGSGIARTAEGQIVFVPFTAPGDEIVALVESIEKRYAFAKLQRILVPSELRVTPPCPAFARCGGCEWQHLPYALQWKTKVKGLRIALDRVQVVYPEEIEELPAEEIWNYRNRVQMRGFGEKLGFFARGTNEIIAIDSCAIARPEINSHLEKVRNQGKSLPRPYKVELALNENNQLLEAWNAQHAAMGFRQVHDGQNLKLRNWVANQICDGDLVWDLFGGKGNLSREISARVQEVHCVDIGADSQTEVRNAADNFFSYKSDVLKWLRKLKPRKNNLSLTVILDPPREGLSTARTEILEILEHQQARRLIFVGCDMDAWAQDLSRTLRRSWRISKIAALDLFPQTHHVEALAVLDFVEK